MENGESSSLAVKEEVKSNGSSPSTPSSGEQSRAAARAMAGFAGSGVVGRLVDSSQADDRRLIRLVRARRPLYARNNMPVASYYAHCKRLWQEVADNMGRSVAEVRRKWSHIRNSYSRHLRNEVLGARTGRGRCVSRWYLADELAFLRDHMATDTRCASSFSQYPAVSLEFADADSEGTGGEGSAVGGGEGGGHSPLWVGAGGAGAADALLQPKVEAVYAASEDSAGSRAGDWEGEGADAEGGLAAFFRPMQGEWAGLSARRRRLFLRQSLALLHALLDEQDAESGGLTHAILPNQ